MLDLCIELGPHQRRVDLCGDGPLKRALDVVRDLPEVIKSAKSELEARAQDLDALEVETDRQLHVLAKQLIGLQRADDAIRMLMDDVLATMDWLALYGNGGEEDFDGQIDAQVAAIASSASKLPARALKGRLCRSRYWSGAVGDALAEGLITYEAAAAIAEIASSVALCDDIHDDVVEFGLSVATSDRGTPSIVRREMRRFIAEHSSAGTEDMCHNERKAYMAKGEDGWARIVFHLPAAEAIEVMQSLNAAADKYQEVASPGEARVHALLDWSRRSANESLADPVAKPVWLERPRVNITIDVRTLFGLAGPSPWIEGCGPIPARLGRDLAADGLWSKWITKDGEVVHATPHVYRPTAALARTLRAQERMCVIPGCSTPSERCDLDHRQPYDRGGATSLANMAPLCRGHHNLKTRKKWALDYDEDTGDYTWSSPSGARYSTRAA